MAGGGRLTHSWQGDLCVADASSGSHWPGTQAGSSGWAGPHSLPAGWSAALPPGKANPPSPVRTAAPWTCPPPPHHLFTQVLLLRSQSQSHCSGEHAAIGLLSPRKHDPERRPEPLIALGLVCVSSKGAESGRCPHRASGWGGDSADRPSIGPPGWCCENGVGHSASCTQRARRTSTGDVSPVHRVRLCPQVALGGAG